MGLAITIDSGGRHDPTGFSVREPRWPRLGAAHAGGARRRLPAALGYTVYRQLVEGARLGGLPPRAPDDGAAQEVWQSRAGGAACSNADPAWVHEWRVAKGALIATGWSADEWTSRSPLKAAEPAVSHGVSFASTAHVALPMDASHVPRWGAQLTANWSRARAWATYHEMQSRFAALIGDREPIMLHGTLPGLGAAPRYMVRIADDSREYLEDLCNKLVAAGGACAVLRNEKDQGARPRDSQSR
jgi:hypothetical protein